MKSRHESHHRHCLLSPFTCFQFLLLFSFFFVIFSSTHSSVKFHPSLWSIAGHTAHEKKSSDASYMRFNLYSNLPLLPTQQPQTTKSRKKCAENTTPLVVWPSLLLFFCFVPSIGPFAFCSWPFLVLREFCSEMRKKNLKKFVQIGLN